MKKDTKIAALTQAKISQYVEKIGSEASRPEKKFIHDVMYGLLKTGIPQLGSIGRSLGESVSVKKRTERLSRHLKKGDLSRKLMKGHRESQKNNLKRCEYMLVDVTDISKKYARKLEGQAGVHDGSAKETGYGYPIVNIAGVGIGRSDVVPAYSELYSLKQELTSENKKILEAIDAVEPFTSQGTAFVMDRGADRSRIFEHLLERKIPFIVRMKNNRHLWTEDGKEVIWKIAKYTKLSCHLKLIRQGKNHQKEHHIICGAKQVRVTKDSAPLWLVSAKYKGLKGGRFYFLTNLDCETEEQLIRKVVRGYHLRWIVEEVHREIKEDLNLESIRLFGYNSIKNMSALSWIAASFYYTKLAGLESMDILLDMGRSVVYRLKLKEITGFVYYKLFYLVNSVLQGTKRIRRTVFISHYSPQLALF
jgi:hypothetical protein